MDLVVVRSLVRAAQQAGERAVAEHGRSVGERSVHPMAATNLHERGDEITERRDRHRAERRRARACGEFIGAPFETSHSPFERREMPRGSRNDLCGLEDLLRLGDGLWCVRRYVAAE